MRAEYRGLNFSVHRVKIKIEGFRIDRLLDKAMKRGLDVRNIRIISPPSGRVLGHAARPCGTEKDGQGLV